MKQRSKKTVIEHYLRKVRRELPIPGKTKRALLQRIRESIYEQTGEAAELDEATLVAKFGTPRQIIESYVENMSVSEFMDDMCVRRKVIRIVFVAVLAAFIIRTVVIGGIWLNHRINGSSEYVTYYITDPEAETEGWGAVEENETEK